MTARSTRSPGPDLPRPRRAMWWASLAALVVAYAALATGYRLATPFGEAPDEAGHIAYVSFLRANGRPPRHGEVGEPLKQQVKHPPLYYALCALAATGQDDRGLLFYRNPQFEPAKPRAEVFTASRHTQAERPPMAPRYAFVAAIRRLSTVLGIVTVLATVLLSLTVLPGRGAHALAAGAVVAFLPQFLFMSGVVNNDALATAAGTMALVAAARVAVRPPRDRDRIVLGLLLGLGLLAKLTTLAIVAVAGVAVALAARRARSWRALARGGALCGGTFLAVAGAWLVWNRLLGGDVLGWAGFESAAAESLRRTPLLPDLPVYLRLQFESFFGRFGWMIVPLPRWMYRLYGGLLAAAAAGLVVPAVRARRRSRASASDPADIGPDGAAAPVPAGDGAPPGLIVLGAACVLVYASAFRLAFAFDLVVAQGRYLFPGLGAFAVLFVLGATAWLPARARPAVQAALAVGWFALGAYGLTGVLRPAFGPVMGRTDASFALGEADACGTCPVFGLGWIRLVVDPCAPVRRIRSGAAATFALRWETTGNQSKDGLMMYAQLVDADGRVVARDDRLPLAGRYPSSAWLVDGRFVETVSLAAPAVDAPRLATVAVGWYPDGKPDAPVAVTGGGEGAASCPDGARGGVTATGDGYAWPVVLVPAEPVTIPPEAEARADTFGPAPGVRLAGWLDRPLVAAAGGPTRRLVLTLYWTAATGGAAGDTPDQRPAAGDTVFVHLTAADGRPVATADGPPAGGRFPPALWRTGDLVPDAHAIDAAGLPDGRYRLTVGWYDAATGHRAAARGGDGAPWAQDEAALGTVVVDGGGVRVER